jgi:hypothetical protein
MAGRHRRNGRKTLALAMAIVGLLAAGIAFAAWTASGDGEGYAQATTAQPLTTVDVSADTVATLYPGATGDVALSISNPNDYAVQVTDVARNDAIAADNVNCNAGSVTFEDQSGLTLDVPANGSAVFTLSGSVSMDGTANDDCQGAVFTIPVTLTGSSNVP